MSENAKAVATSSARIGPLHAARLVRKVDAALVEFHGRHLSELGIDGSGLFTHYADLLSQGAILRADEIQVFSWCGEALPVYGGYAALRAGLGDPACEIARNSDLLRGGFRIQF